MLTLRPPRPDEAVTLTELCLRSKAAHGYDAAFMAACRPELTLDCYEPDHRYLVADEDGVAVGLAEVAVDGVVATLEKLFVDPLHFGKGIGRRLFSWAEREARSLGAQFLTIDSDPDAKDFYLAMGAVDDGMSPSGSITGRYLPKLRLDLTESDQR